MRILRFLIVAIVFSSPTPVTSAETVNVEVSSSDQMTVPEAETGDDQSAEYDSLMKRLENLESQIQAQDKWGDRLAVFFAIFVSVFGIAPLVYTILSQRRERPITALFMQGEQGRQTQAREIHETFLKGSSDTIRLVNDTLTLAKEASERAASSIERRAKDQLETLDASAQDLLMRPASGDDRALVSNPQNRSELESLAEQISAFDIYRVVLDERINLTPRCFFIKGMHSHIKQHYEEAIRHWQKAATDPSADASLRSLAWYWKGYESNNLGKFDEAKAAFEAALHSAEGARVYELKRIGVESEFFDSVRNPTHLAVDKIRSLLESAKADKAPAESLDSIRGTVGNILYSRGRELRAQDEDGDWRNLFEEARAVYEQVSKPNKWSFLGFAQCCLQLNDRADEARRVLLEKVRPAAQAEFVNRVEPRTKALARYTELICCLANKSLEHEVAGIHSQLLSAIGDVDNRLTLYSLLQRRNVSKEQFQQDIIVVMQERSGA